MIFLLDKHGLEKSPTPAMVYDVIDSNATAYYREWIAVTAHEIGHLLGANEVI